jgi:hypothetical protein
MGEGTVTVLIATPIRLVYSRYTARSPKATLALSVMVNALSLGREENLWEYALTADFTIMSESKR